MSKFIGPIHYWLYRKIQVVSQREEYIYNKAYELCGSTAEELREQVQQTYGQPLPDVDLSELIDHDNIHGWLQRQINIAESREAAFIKELLDVCGGNAQDIVEQAFCEHGKMTGEKAKLLGKCDINTAPGIYKALECLVIRQIWLWLRSLTVLFGKQVYVGRNQIGNESELIPRQ